MTLTETSGITKPNRTPVAHRQTRCSNTTNASAGGRAQTQTGAGPGDWPTVARALNRYRETGLAPIEA
eukprot:4524566-Lingulodinium_polyedra.AAC.1